MSTRLRQKKMELGWGSEVEHLLSMHRAGGSTYGTAGRKQKEVCVHAWVCTPDSGYPH